MTETVTWSISADGPESGYKPLAVLRSGVQWVRVARHTIEPSGPVAANLVAPLNVTILRWDGRQRTYTPLSRGAEDADFGGPVQFDTMERAWVPADFTWVSFYLLVLPTVVMDDIFLKYQTPGGSWRVSY